MVHCVSDSATKIFLIVRDEYAVVLGTVFEQRSIVSGFAEDPFGGHDIESVRPKCRNEYTRDVFVRAE